jgi:glycosyltransferase involved in cell wall biosynthesis
MAGTPVVATAAGGVPTVVRDGETGRLVPVQQPEALAAALADLIKNPEDAAKMADRARTLAESSFSLEGMVDAHEALYRQVLNG